MNTTNFMPKKKERKKTGVALSTPWQAELLILKHREFV